MVDLISVVNPNYQKAVDAVSGSKPAEKTEKPAGEAGDEAVKENMDTYVPEDKTPVKEDTGVSYKPNAALVEAMKKEQAAQEARFINMMKSMLTKQGKVFGQSTDYTVTPEVQAAAKEAISEDGYWGVKQTSERIVNFGKALVGGDPARVGEMRDAFIKGFEAATKAWGGALPGIAQETYDAAMKLFDEWEKEGAVDKAPETEAPAE